MILCFDHHCQEIKVDVYIILCQKLNKLSFQYCAFFFICYCYSTIIKKETVTKYSIQKAFQLCPNRPGWTDSFGILSCLALKAIIFATVLS